MSGSSEGTEFPSTDCTVDATASVTAARDRAGVLDVVAVFDAVLEEPEACWAAAGRRVPLSGC